MALFGFKSRFVEPIKARTKKQTIRKERKRMPADHSILRLQHGSRFKPKLIGWAHLERTDPVVLDLRRNEIMLPRVILDEPSELDAFAVSDGFDDWADMKAWWNEEHEGVPIFEGFIFFWGDSFRLNP